MSRRTQRSAQGGPRARRSGRSETPEAVLDAAVTAIVASIRRDGDGLAGVADPLEAEVFASGILAGAGRPPRARHRDVRPVRRSAGERGGQGADAAPARALPLLPTPRPIEPPEIPDEDREELVEAFAASPEAAGLEAVGGGPSADLARWFVDFACDYGAGDPLRWSPIAVEILLADWLPRKAILEQPEVDVLPEVLRRFVRFSARRKGLADGTIAETLEAVDRFAPDFAEGMADDERAGPAKEIALGLRAAGIDVADEAAVQRWIDERNEALRIPRT